MSGRDEPGAWESARVLRRATVAWVTAASVFFGEHPERLPVDVQADLEAYRTLVASSPIERAEVWLGHLFLPAYAMAQELSGWLGRSGLDAQLPRRLRVLLEEFRTADARWHRTPLGRAE